MKIFKGYIKNPYRPEASIVERYIVEEAISVSPLRQSQCALLIQKITILSWL